MKIVNVQEYPGGLEQAARYFNRCWPSLDYRFYLDSIRHSSQPDRPLPRFYLVLDDARIIGCYGLVANDFISRHDLWPWFAALYVEESERGRALGAVMLDHALREAGRLGFPMVYLTTDHDGYYEKYGWTRIEDGYERDGTPARIYARATVTADGG